MERWIPCHKRLIDTERTLKQNELLKICGSNGSHFIKLRIRLKNSGPNWEFHTSSYPNPFVVLFRLCHVSSIHSFPTTALPPFLFNSSIRPISFPILLVSLYHTFRIYTYRPNKVSKHFALLPPLCLRNASLTASKPFSFTFSRHPDQGKAWSDQNHLLSFFGKYKKDRKGIAAREIDHHSWKGNNTSFHAGNTCVVGRQALHFLCSPQGWIGWISTKSLGFRFPLLGSSVSPFKLEMKEENWILMGYFFFLWISCY